MEVILAIAALVLLIVSFLGLLKVLCRIFAVLCVIGAVWFWTNGGKEKLATGLETGLSMIFEQTADLGGEDREGLEAAIRNPDAVLGLQKQGIRENVAGLLETPKISFDVAAREVLEQLAARFDQCSASSKPSRSGIGCSRNSKPSCKELEWPVCFSRAQFQELRLPTNGRPRSTARSLRTSENDFSNDGTPPCGQQETTPV